MMDGGSLLSEYGAGPAQLATTPTSACAVAAGDVGTVVEAAIVAGDAAVREAAAGDQAVDVAGPLGDAAAVVGLDAPAELD